jgi:hypothetical protein
MLTHQYEDLNNKNNLLIAFEFSKKKNKIWKKNNNLMICFQNSP